MRFKRSIKRFAHIAGYAFVTYAENGDILTSGSVDGDIRIWKEIGDDDPSSLCAGETANCCIQYHDPNDDQPKLIATSENYVQNFKFPSFDRDRVEFRFNSAVTALRVSKKFMAAGSADSTIKVKKMGDSSDDLIELSGNKGAILYIDLHATKNHLASSTSEGSIIIWNLDTKEVLKSIDGLPKAKSLCYATFPNTPTFEKSGKYLAFPKGKSIQILDTTDYEVKFELENDKISGNFSACSFSHCGNYLAAGSHKGEISVWKVATKEIIKGQYQGEEDHSITAIEWSPIVKDEFAFVDIDGQLSTAKIQFSDIDENEGENLMSVDEKAEDIDDIYGGIDFKDDDNDEDADNENCVALEKLKNETLNGDSSSDDDMESNKSVKSYRSIVAVRKFPLQPPFQPGSSPENLEHRFMIWNHVGHVVSHKSEDENSIIVEFADVSVHSSLHMINTLNHQLASLSTTCLALATKESPSKLVCIALQSGGGKEWSMNMPGCEEIVCLATGDSFVAAATNSNFIRFFTTMGTQREVISVPGQIVCISAQGNKLIVAYHTSTTRNKFSLMVISIFGLVMSNRTVELPTSSESKLSWIGFSDTGSIISYESNGIMQSYNIKRNLWMQICDLTEHFIGASDSFFIVGVSEKSQKIRATLCRGTSYPLTNPRPILREVDYALTLCSIESEKSKIEETLVRSTNFEMEKCEKAIVENALKLFSMAMNAELETRAFEIVELIGDKKLIELASKYAGQKGRMHLAGKIMKLMSLNEEKEEEKINISNALEKDTNAFAEMYEVTTPRTREIVQSTPIIAPRPMISQKKANPFAKKPADKSTISAINHLSKKSIGYSESITHSDDENVPVNNSTLQSTNSSISKDTPRPGNFAQWFIANKESLITDNPGKSDTELMKIGKVFYKELTQSESSPVTTNLPLNKRKLEMSEDEGGKSKLSKYGFSE